MSLRIKCASQGHILYKQNVTCLNDNYYVVCFSGAHTVQANVIYLNDNKT